MLVTKTLTEGLDSTSYTHTNPFVEIIPNERQAQKTITYKNEYIKYKDEWFGTSDQINDLLNSKIPDIKTYEWTEDEEWFIERQKGDLSKLTHTYSSKIESGDGVDSSSDPVNESIGITPWTIKSETTDIGAIDYYILKFKLTEAQKDTIKRERIALWEQSPYEQKLEYKYYTLTNGYITVDKEPAGGNSDSPLTLEIAKWIVKEARQQYPLTSARITHEYVVKGPNYKNGKVNKHSLAKELADPNSAIRFPSGEFGKELETIPDCPYTFEFSYPTRFMLVDWNVKVQNNEGKYLVTKEYLSYPEAFPLPIDPTPGDDSDTNDDNNNNNNNNNDNNNNDNTSDDNNDNTSGDTSGDNTSGDNGNTDDNGNTETTN